MVKEQSDESPLPRHELLAAPVEVALDEGGWRNFRRSKLFKLDLDPSRAPSDFVDDRIGQRLPDVPEMLEFLFDPSYAVARRVFETSS